MDRDRADILRTQAMDSVLSALGAAQPHVYGPLQHEWRGVILEARDKARAVTHWREGDDMVRYSVVVRLDVEWEVL